MILGYKKNFKPFPEELRKKVSNVMLFTNARNEKNIREWAAHHLLLGFDLIYIYDHKSEPSLNNYFKNTDKRVIIERCEMNNPVKLPLMMKAANTALKFGADWFIYLDADEFLILNSFENVKQMLQVFSFADLLSINWLMFGTSGHIKDPEGLILENYTKSDLMLNQHIKSFVRPSQILRVSTPHYYSIKNPLRMITINNKVMSAPYSFNQTNLIEYHKSHAYIAHYAYQSQESYIKRKINLPTDDTNMQRSLDNDIHQKHNATDNIGPKIKYASKVRTYMDQSL
jgi:hypothetical protein